MVAGRTVLVREPARVPEVLVVALRRLGNDAAPTLGSRPVNGTALSRLCADCVACPEVCADARDTPGEARRPRALRISAKQVVRRVLGVELREDEGVADATPQSPQRSDHLDAVRAQRGVRLGCDVLEPLGKVVEEIPDLLLEEVRRQAEVGLHDVEELGDIARRSGRSSAPRHPRSARRTGPCVAASASAGSEISAELVGERLEAGRSGAAASAASLCRAWSSPASACANAFCLRYRRRPRTARGCDRRRPRRGGSRRQASRRRRTRRLRASRPRRARAAAAGTRTEPTLICRSPLRR